MIGIDWVAAVVLIAAILFSQIKTVPIRVRNWVFALACFGIAGWRLRNGAEGMNLIFVGLATAMGISYAVQALRAPKAR